MPPSWRLTGAEAFRSLIIRSYADTSCRQSGRAEQPLMRSGRSRRLIFSAAHRINSFAYRADTATEGGDGGLIRPPSGPPSTGRTGGPRSTPPARPVDRRAGQPGSNGRGSSPTGSRLRRRGNLRQAPSRHATGGTPHRPQLSFQWVPRSASWHESGCVMRASRPASKLLLQNGLFCTCQKGNSRHSQSTPNVGSHGGKHVSDRQDGSEL